LIAREAVVVEQFEERGEGLQVAVVRGRGEEEAVLAVRGQQLHSPGALRVDRVLSRSGRRARVYLVHDQQVEGAGIFRHLGQ
jgi:hypothetical protein